MALVLTEEVDGHGAKWVPSGKVFKLVVKGTRKEEVQIAFNRFADVDVPCETTVAVLELSEDAAKEFAGKQITIS